MHVTVNGESVELSEGSQTVLALLEARNLHGSPCAVEVNQSLVPKRMHAEHVLHDGDCVEIVTLVGGG